MASAEGVERDLETTDGGSRLGWRTGLAGGGDTGEVQASHMGTGRTARLDQSSKGSSHCVHSAAGCKAWVLRGPGTGWERCWAGEDP